MKEKKEKYFLSQFMKCSGKMSLRIKCLIPDGTAKEALVCVCVCVGRYATLRHRRLWKNQEDAVGNKSCH